MEIFGANLELYSHSDQLRSWRIGLILRSNRRSSL